MRIWGRCERFRNENPNRRFGSVRACDDILLEPSGGHVNVLRVNGRERVSLVNVELYHKNEIQSGGVDGKRNDSK